MMHMTRCLGVILLNPTTNKVTMMDNLKDRFQKWKITHVNDLTGEQMVALIDKMTLQEYLLQFDNHSCHNNHLPPCMS